MDSTIYVAKTKLISCTVSAPLFLHVQKAGFLMTRLKCFMFQELILCSVFTCYFGILSAFSPNFLWMLILRGLVGFGIGGAPQS